MPRTMPNKSPAASTARSNPAMTDREKPKSQSLVGPKSVYEIGYGKPPVASRFKKGRSGNPSGRRQGTKKATVLPALNDERMKRIILGEAYRTIDINDINGSISIPMVQAIVRSLAVNAAKGNQRAQRLFTQLLSSVEKDNKRAHDEWVQTAINYKADWDEELERCRKLGIQAPDPVPHPDHITIDMPTGSVRITGPMTREEKAKFDRYEAYTADSLSEVAELKKLLESKPNHPGSERLQQTIDHIEASIEKVETALAEKFGVGWRKPRLR
jgi:Family of unknown function (DUF5681)